MRRALAPVAVVVGYLVLALVLTWTWWTPLGGRLTAVNPPDAVLFSWLLGWTPHALAEGSTPLFSPLLNVPDGINLMWNNGMLLPAVLLAPVTAVFGGLGTVTVIMTIGLAGTATSAFFCLRALDVRWLPAALGGLLAGFSPAMLAQTAGAHPNLVLNVLAPVLVLLAVRLMVEERPRVRTAALLGVTAGAQVLIGEEVLFDAGIVVAVLLLVLVVGRPRAALARARVFAARALVALGTFLLVGGPFLAYQMFGPLRMHGTVFDSSYYSADLAGHVVPTRLQALASGADVDRSARFAGNLEEHTAYLGWPLIVLCALGLLLGARARVALLAAVVVAALALGPEITVDGRGTGVPGPWAALASMPGFEHVLPGRLALFTALLAGAGLAFALDRLRWRPLGVAVVLAAMIPLVPAPFPGRDAPAVPPLFTSPEVSALACPGGGSALVLPFPRPTATDAMAWQQAAGYSFAMPGGYLIAPDATGQATLAGAPTATGSLLHDVATDGVVRPVTPELKAAFTADLARWRTCAAAVRPTRHRDALQEQLTLLTGRAPEHVGGVALWRHLP